MSDDWKRDLQRNGRGMLANSANVVTILRMDPAWAGIVAYNEFSLEIEKLKPAPWADMDRPKSNTAGPWTDEDFTRLKNYISRTYLVDVPERDITKSVVLAAQSASYHPVVDYLNRCEKAWDRTPRLSRVMPVYANTEDNPYTCGVGPKWFIGAVARILRPGSQMDTVLILESDQQGWRKTSFFRALVPDESWFSETSLTAGDKDSYQYLRGKWIYLLDELDSMAKSEISAIKNYLSKQHDDFRPAYERLTVHRPRSNVFAGTTNDRQYMPDVTGNRRYWPMALLKAADHKTLERDRDQLWGEATARFKAGEAWHVDDPDLQALCVLEQGKRVRENPLLGPIETWYSKQERLHGEAWEGATAAEALRGALGLTYEDMAPHMANAKAALRVLGCTRSQVGSSSMGSRESRYTRQPHLKIVEVI